ncbi:aminopeptidase P family protein [Motilibacter deserti]|uniref:Xaa-Pro aminopeptidase n=1 Tax=Motilibacter deserti TaxID=2714956 RepID=A0ABX0GZW1_9ACTN|nr:aminopeptidase P family protein [Motilibacter deserti]NHC14748.1 aminopeptidase P family protein [Motilibacter deserti]
MSGGWGPLHAPVDVPAELAPWAQKRRARLAERFPGEHLVVHAGEPLVRANDQTYPFRPASDYLWLTGDATPGGVLVLDPEGQATLYAPPPAPPGTRDFWASRSGGALWNGAQPTLEAVAEVLGIPVLPLADLPAGLGARAAGNVAAPDRELAAALSELRLLKDGWELEQLQLAVDATTRGFADVVRALPAAMAGGGERLLETTFFARARQEGGDVGYHSIVGAGEHATVLHWMRNDGAVRDGQLLLLDAGVETRTFYTADVTRVLPVNGRFAPLQRDVYELVRRANDAALEAVRPGAAFRDFHWAAMRVLAEGVHGLGLLPGSLDEALDPERQLYRRWTLCGSGHMLGIDVHDCAKSRAGEYVDGRLRAGQVLTVEPGLYFQPNDELVPPELRGLGMRIEEDLVVTENGYSMLSSALPRTAADVESWMQSVATS